MRTTKTFCWYTDPDSPNTSGEDEHGTWEQRLPGGNVYTSEDGPLQQQEAYWR